MSRLNSCEGMIVFGISSHLDLRAVDVAVKNGVIQTGNRKSDFTLRKFRRVQNQKFDFVTSNIIIQDSIFLLKKEDFIFFSTRIRSLIMRLRVSKSDVRLRKTFQNQEVDFRKLNTQIISWILLICHDRLMSATYTCHCHPLFRQAVFF